MLDPEKMALARMGQAGAQAVSQLADSNIDQLISSLATGIAQAQFALDSNSVRLAKLMSGMYVVATDADGSPIYDADGSSVLIRGSGKVDFGGEKLSLLELGFTPTFYQFVETVLEVKMSISLSADVKVDRTEHTKTTTKETKVGFFKSKTTTRVKSVSSRFSARFQYSVEASSLVRTKLVPVPTPTLLLEVLDREVGRA